MFGVFFMIHFVPSDSVHMLNVFTFLSFFLPVEWFAARRESWKYCDESVECDNGGDEGGWSDKEEGRREG